MQVPPPTSPTLTSAKPVEKKKRFVKSKLAAKKTSKVLRKGAIETTKFVGEVTMADKAANATVEATKTTMQFLKEKFKRFWPIGKIWVRRGVVTSSSAGGGYLGYTLAATVPPPPVGILIASAAGAAFFIGRVVHVGLKKMGWKNPGTSI